VPATRKDDKSDGERATGKHGTSFPHRRHGFNQRTKKGRRDWLRDARSKPSRPGSIAAAVPQEPVRSRKTSVYSAIRQRPLQLGSAYFSNACIGEEDRL